MSRTLKPRDIVRQVRRRPPPPTVTPADRWNRVVEIGAPVELRIATPRGVLVFRTRTSGPARLSPDGEPVVPVRGLLSPARLSQLEPIRS